MHRLKRAHQGSLVVQQQLATGWEGDQQRTQRQGTVSQVADAICRQDDDRGELLSSWTAFSAQNARPWPAGRWSHQQAGR